MFESSSLVLRVIIAVCCFAYSSLLLKSCHKNSGSFHGGIGELAFAFWAILDLVQSAVQTTEILIIVQSLVYLCAQISTCSLISFTYYLFVPKRYDQKSHISYIYLLPFFTTIVMIVMRVFSTSHLFIKVPDYILGATLPAYNFPKTVFYYIHSVFCYVSIFLCIAYSFYSELKQKMSSRITILSYTLSAMFFFIINIYKFFIENFFLYTYVQFSDMPTSISYFVFSIATFITVYFQKKERSMRALNGDLFASSCYPIFVFSNDDKLIEANTCAHEFFDFYSISKEQRTTFSGIFSESIFARLGFFEDVQQKDEFYLSSIQNKSLYYGRKVGLFEGKKQIGYYIIIVQVTIYSEIMRRIEKEADTDDLTGLKKTSTFNRVFTEEINSHVEPILLVCARINNLEHLNTAVGIKKTNFYITSFANILKTTTTQFDIQHEMQKQIFRISGSLFVFIISVKQQDKIQELFKGIKRECGQFSKNRVEELSCSLGYSIANNRETSASKVLQKSYENMFFDKK